MLPSGITAGNRLRREFRVYGPPPPEKLKAQGSAIFKNQVTPAIDPANYQQQ